MRTEHPNCESHTGVYWIEYIGFVMQSQSLYVKITKYCIIHILLTLANTLCRRTCLATSLVSLDLTHQHFCYSFLLTNHFDDRNWCSCVLHTYRCREWHTRLYCCLRAMIFGVFINYVSEYNSVLVWNWSCVESGPESHDTMTRVGF